MFSLAYCDSHSEWIYPLAGMWRKRGDNVHNLRFIATPRQSGTCESSITYVGTWRLCCVTNVSSADVATVVGDSTGNEHRKCSIVTLWSSFVFTTKTCCASASQIVCYFRTDYCRELLYLSIYLIAKAGMSHLYGGFRRYGPEGDSYRRTCVEHDNESVFMMGCSTREKRDIF